MTRAQSKDPKVKSIYKTLCTTGDLLWESGNRAEANRYYERAARFIPTELTRAKAHLGARAQ